MRMILKGEDCGFSWSASHLLPGHTKCSRIHGHNYVMDIEIESKQLDDHGMIVDFIEIKKYIRSMIEDFDHRLMLPGLVFSDNNTSKMIVIRQIINNIDLYKISYLGINDKEKLYFITQSDVVFIDGIDFVTAENLSLYFKNKVIKVIDNMTKNKDTNNFTVNVAIYEDAGQGAMA